MGGAVLLGDCSRTSFRPWVPANLRKKIFDLHHGLAHSGVKPSVRLISQRFVWHDLKRDVAKWARQCLDCQRVKVHRHMCPSLDHLPVPEGHFRHVYVDLVGHLPPSEGHTYLLTAVDRFSRWPEAFPLRSTDAATVAQAFNLGWVSRFGIPEVIISDRGPQFVSSLWDEMAKTLGTSLHRTSAYHPQSNGMVERLHRQLKASLTARLKDAAWIRQLPWVLLGVRAAVKEDLSCSPAEMLYGHQLRLPGQAPQEDPLPDPSAFGRELRRAMEHLRPSPTAHHRSTRPAERYVPAELGRCPLVWVRRDGHHAPLTPHYDGPYEVLGRGPKTFRLRLGDREDTVAIDRLKPADAPEGTEPAEPPRWGRPPTRPAAQPRVPQPGTERLSSQEPTRPADQSPEQLPEPQPRTTTRTGRVIRKPSRFIQCIGGGHVAGTLCANAPAFFPETAPTV